MGAGVEGCAWLCAGDTVLATPCLVATDERYGYPGPFVDHTAAVSEAKRFIGAVRA